MTWGYVVKRLAHDHAYAWGRWALIKIDPKLAALHARWRRLP